MALEANAAGVPVIAAAAGGLCEAISDGETGIIMTDRDPANWAYAITALLTDESRRTRLGAAGRRRAKQYTWQHAAVKLDKQYRELFAEFARLKGDTTVPEPFQPGDRVLFLHAHPDDETLATGALIAELVKAGVQCQLVTATRGEAGEIVPGSLTGKPAELSLAQHREAELQAAVRQLGITKHAYLGTAPARAADAVDRVYRDSGMRWISPGVAGPAVDAAADSLTLTDISEQIADVTELLASWQPTKLVSYNSHGGYGHPDHVRVHEITKTVAALWRLPAYQVQQQPEAAEYWFELQQHREVVRAALDCHRTQLTVHGDMVTHSGGQQEKIPTRLGLSRLEPDEVIWLD